MMRILVTTEFCNVAKDLSDSKDKSLVHTLRTILIHLANGWNLPKKYHDHQLQNSEFRELHISGDVLLLYKYDTDSQTLAVSLKLTNITDHKKLSRESHRTNYNYKEVSTEELHDITSSVKLDSVDEELLNDTLESISDYASMKTVDGYILLDDYHIDGDSVNCQYDYYLYENDSRPADSIHFVIDLAKYPVIQLQDYIDTFSTEVKSAFEG